jgi:ketosteroid isomerase-like protein
MLPRLVVLLLATTSPSEDRTLRQELQAAYDALAAACVAQDLSAAMAMLAPDIHWALVDGSRLDRAAVEESMRDFLKTLGPGSSAKYTLVSVKRRGESVLVDVHLTATTVQPDPDRPGKTLKHVGRSGWHDVWVKGAAGWQNTSGQEYELPAKKAP